MGSRCAACLRAQHRVVFIQLGAATTRRWSRRRLLHPVDERARQHERQSWWGVLDWCRQCAAARWLTGGDAVEWDIDEHTIPLVGAWMVGHDRGSSSRVHLQPLCRCRRRLQCFFSGHHDCARGCCGLDRAEWHGRGTGPVGGCVDRLGVADHLTNRGNAREFLRRIAVRERASMRRSRWLRTANPCVGTCASERI